MICENLGSYPQIVIKLWISIKILERYKKGPICFFQTDPLPDV